MTVSRKPSRKDIEKVINKGGDITHENKEEEYYRLTLRMPKELKEAIDKAIKKRKIKVARTHFILESIIENLRNYE